MQLSLLVCLIGIFNLPVGAEPDGYGSSVSLTLANRFMELEFSKSPEPRVIRLTNRLSGDVFPLRSLPFQLGFEWQGETVTMYPANCEFKGFSRPGNDRLDLLFEGGMTGVKVGIRVCYELAVDSWFARKWLEVNHSSPTTLLLKDAGVDTIEIPGMNWPVKVKNPVFFAEQAWWGLEWPNADVRVVNKRLLLAHYPAVDIKPGSVWKSKRVGFGVAEPGKVEPAFGRYIQEIRINSTDFVTLYFDWLCHDNSGPLESEILANFAALKRLRVLYGLQFDIYNSDAGLLESQGTYFPEYENIFRERFPNGLETIAVAARNLGMELGYWIGPDGFGETGPEMEERKRQLISWVRDFNGGLFKFDTVVSPLRHKDKYVLERKYQALADAMKEIRRINPNFVAINHRINQSPYILTLTDSILWGGQETYIDVHMMTPFAGLHNRDQAISRPLSTQYYDTPSRLFEDHGVCFNSCIENWGDDLVAQAFGRASITSPELYGAFFFLPDDDYPRLANLIKLHKRVERALLTPYFLPDGDIARSDGEVSLIVLRNLSWQTSQKTISLDGSIGLSPVKKNRLLVRQRHPLDRVVMKGSKPYRFGDTLSVSLDPYEVRLFQVNSEPVGDPMVVGLPYQLIQGADQAGARLEVFGLPGERARVTFNNLGSRTLSSVDRQIEIVRNGTTASASLSFEGRKLDQELFSLESLFKDSSMPREEGRRLTEFVKFNLNDDALEIRELERLRKAPSRFPEIETCRAYMLDRVKAVGGSHRNAFDGDMSTTWSDGFGRRQPFSGNPQPYRSETSLWRLNLGRLEQLSRLVLRINRYTRQAVLNSMEFSPDLEKWLKVEKLQFPALDSLPPAGKVRNREGGKRVEIEVFDTGDSGLKPIPVNIAVPPGDIRYIRIRGRNFSVAEIEAFSKDGTPLDRNRWRASNFYGKTSLPARILQASCESGRFWPGKGYAVAVHSGDTPLDAVDGVYVLARIADDLIVPEHRVTSYPYHSYENNCFWSIQRNGGVDGLTFRFAAKKNWAGKRIDFYIFLYGDGRSDVKAELHRVTEPYPWEKKTFILGH